MIKHQCMCLSPHKQIQLLLQVPVKRKPLPLFPLCYTLLAQGSRCRHLSRHLLPSAYGLMQSIVTLRMCQPRSRANGVSCAGCGLFIVCYVKHAAAVRHAVDILAPLGQYGSCDTVWNTRAFRAVKSAVTFCKQCYRVQCTVKLFFTMVLYCTVYSCKNILRTDCGGSQEDSFADPTALSTGESAQKVHAAHLGCKAAGRWPGSPSLSLRSDALTPAPQGVRGALFVVRRGAPALGCI